MNLNISGKSFEVLNDYTFKIIVEFITELYNYFDDRIPGTEELYKLKNYQCPFIISHIIDHFKNGICGRKFLNVGAGFFSLC